MALPCPKQCGREGNPDHPGGVCNVCYADLTLGPGFTVGKNHGDDAFMNPFKLMLGIVGLFILSWALWVAASEWVCLLSFTLICPSS